MACGRQATVRTSIGRARQGADKISGMLLDSRVDRPATEAEAVQLAAELYGIRAAARALPGEYDDNFHLTEKAGAAKEAPLQSPGYVLKVMHPAREASFVDMQCRALQHLAQRAAHLGLPRVMPGRDGQFFRAITTADGSSRLVWLLKFVPGTVLADVRPHSAE